MVILEPAAMKVAFGENPKRVYKGKGKMPITRMATAAILRNALNNAKNYRAKKLRAINNGELFDIDLKMEALIPVLEKKIPLKAHAHRADDILTAIRIAKEFDVNVTIDHCTDGILIADYIKDAGVSALVGPTMSFRAKQETKNKTFETPRILNGKGVRVAIITDHPVTPINYLPLCAGLAVKAGLNMKEAFKMITINAAEILGVNERIGSIEVGKDADLAIFDGNPMETMTNTLYTIIDGQIIYSKDMINLNL
jgi:imidazolonepropionase-like amidohydrolase